MQRISRPEPGQIYIEVKNREAVVSRWEAFPQALPTGTALAAENAEDLRAQAEGLLRAALGELPPEGRYPWPDTLSSLPVFAQRAGVEVSILSDERGAGVEQGNKLAEGVLYRVRAWRGLLVVGGQCYPVARIAEESLTERRLPNLLLYTRPGQEDGGGGRTSPGASPASHCQWVCYAVLPRLADTPYWVQFGLQDLEAARQWVLVEGRKRDAMVLPGFREASAAFGEHQCASAETDLCLCWFSYACPGCGELQVVHGEDLAGHPGEGMCEACLAAQ